MQNYVYLLKVTGVLFCVCDEENLTKFIKLAAEYEKDEDSSVVTIEEAEENVRNDMEKIKLNTIIDDEIEGDEIESRIE